MCFSLNIFSNFHKKGESWWSLIFGALPKTRIPFKEQKENEDCHAEAFDLASAYLTGFKVDGSKNKLTIAFDESDFGYDSLACDYEFSGDTLLLSYVDEPLLQTPILRRNPKAVPLYSQGCFPEPGN